MIVLPELPPLARVMLRRPLEQEDENQAVVLAVVGPNRLDRTEDVASRGAVVAELAALPHVEQKEHPPDSANLRLGRAGHDQLPLKRKRQETPLQT